MRLDLRDTSGGTLEGGGVYRESSQREVREVGPGVGVRCDEMETSGPKGRE